MAAGRAGWSSATTKEDFPKPKVSWPKPNGVSGKLKTLLETVSGPKAEKIRPDMAFGEWLDFWYQNWSKPKLRPTTQANYEAKIYQHIIPELGKIPLNQLAPEGPPAVLCPDENGRAAHPHPTVWREPVRTPWSGAATPPAGLLWKRRCRRN